MDRFKGKTVALTGGGGGIGGATCRRFAAEGAAMAVLDLNLVAAQRVADGIRANGGRAEAFQCDITDRTSDDTEESREGVKALQEKRKPEFRKFAK